MYPVKHSQNECVKKILHISGTTLQNKLYFKYVVGFTELDYFLKLIAPPQIWVG